MGLLINDLYSQTNLPWEGWGCFICAFVQGCGCGHRITSWSGYLCRQVVYSTSHTPAGVYSHSIDWQLDTDQSHLGSETLSWKIASIRLVQQSTLKTSLSFSEFISLYFVKHIVGPHQSWWTEIHYVLGSTVRQFWKVIFNTSLVIPRVISDRTKQERGVCLSLN